MKLGNKRFFYRPCRPSLAVRARDAESSGPVTTAHNISINVTMWQMADWPTCVKDRSLQCSHDNKAGSLQWQKASCTPDLRTARHSVAHRLTTWSLTISWHGDRVNPCSDSTTNSSVLVWAELSCCDSPWRSVTGTKEKISWWRAALTHGRGKRGTY